MYICMYVLSHYFSIHVAMYIHNYLLYKIQLDLLHLVVAY